MKAIIPVAGLGTRLMPLTAHQPKALVGIVDRPMIHYAIQEADALGIREMIFVISPRQVSIKKYIVLAGLSNRARFVIQKKPTGNADAILRALPLLSKESACVFFCDDILDRARPIMERAVRLSKEKSAPVVILEQVPKLLIPNYGIVKAKGEGGGVYRVLDIVEKPKPQNAPSNLSVVGRYVLNYAFLSYIKKLYAKSARISRDRPEIGMTDVIELYLNSGGRVYGLEFRGERFDCGSKLGLMKAQAYFGFRHKEMGKHLRRYAGGLF